MTTPLPQRPPAPPAWRLLLVDDEPLARQRLRKLLTEVAVTVAGVPVLDLGEAANAAEARAALGARAWQALLLDIRMPGTDGLALARELRETARQQGHRPPALVFVTAHAEHALDAFEVEAVDYLTKPVRRDRLAEVLQRLLGRLGSPLATPPDTPPITPLATLPVTPTQPAPGVPSALAVPEATDESALAGGDEEAVVVVQDRGRVVRVPAGEIVWLKAELKYVTLRTAHATWLVDESLAELEGRLGRRFLRIHRNALVAVPALRRLERRLVEDAAAGEASDMGAAGEAWAAQVAPTGEWLAVSRRQVAVVRACLARRPSTP